MCYNILFVVGHCLEIKVQSFLYLLVQAKLFIWGFFEKYPTQIDKFFLMYENVLHTCMIREKSLCRLQTSHLQTRGAPYQIPPNRGFHL